MKRLWFIFAAVLLLAVAVFLFFHRRADGVLSAERFPELRGDYLGQRPPAATPELFAPGIVSTGYPDSVPVFSADGNEAYWSRLAGRGRGGLLVSRQENGRWSYPERLSFAAPQTLDAAPSLGAADERLLFISRRTVGDAPPAAGCFSLWTSTRRVGGWSPPVALGPAVNSGFEDFSVLTAEGALYVSSWRPGGPGKSSAAIYRSRPLAGGWGEPEKLPAAINSEAGAIVDYVAPHEDFLVFESERPGGQGGTDLYVSFHQGDAWGAPIHLGNEVNSPGYEHFASLSADGKYFFFASDRGGNLDVYWLEAGFLAALRPAAPPLASS